MSSPPPTRDELGRRLRAACVLLARSLRAADSDLTPTQLTVLATIHRTGRVRLGDLAAKEQLSPAMITRVVQSLVDAGLVERNQACDDRRVIFVMVSPAGRERVVSLMARADSVLTRRLTRLDASELAVVAGAVGLIERLAVDDG